MQLLISDFIQNNFFNRQFLTDELPKLFRGGEPEVVFQKIKQLYDKNKFNLLSEAQLEEEFIKPTLQALDFAFAYQVSKKAFGKSHKPDFALFENEQIKDEHYQSDKGDSAQILALCESKAYNVTLDNKKIDTENPHFQLIRYLNDLKIDYGFLTNGRFWRFYETKENRAEKVFYEIDLEKIIEAEDAEAFNYFYYIFRQANYIKPSIDDKKSQVIDIQQLTLRNEAAKTAVENDLKNIIYGEDSIIELIGQRLYAKFGAEYGVAEVYENSVVFAFRLLFVAYFEDKFYQTLFEKHRFYKTHSLHALRYFLQDEANFPPQAHNGWGKLKDLFRILDEGREDDQIPLLNGGLFAPDKAPLLAKSQVLTNTELKYLLNLLLQFADNQIVGLFQRDFKTLAIRHIGNIYEGLLEFEFREVLNEDVFYLVYTEKNKELEGFFDVFDYHELKNDKKKAIVSEQKYTKGQIYLSNRSNSRKMTASYYTPAELTQFMAKEALSQARQNEPDILKLRILDNACGSGHFLLEILNQVTQLAYNQLDSQPALQQTLQTEKATIQQSIQTYLGDTEVDELVLLKRLLLKKLIFGVDLNPFAVELTRLSLWLDTFILGTPLSFIEHHIKQGNALIGSNLQNFIKNIEGEIFKNQIDNQLQELRERLTALSNLRDTTQTEILESKRIYQNLLPSLQFLNQILHLETYRSFLQWEYKNAEEKAKFSKLLNQVYQNFRIDTFAKDYAEIIAEVEKVAQKYHFFHYEVEFAEVFNHAPSGGDGGGFGFHIVIGNPPWDKTKFEDKDFFAMYRSSYRTMLQSEKNQVRQNILAYPQVKEQYQHIEDNVLITNEFYKTHFPLNAGAGDGNLFRFFIENNLRLLRPQACLTYLTPSAWIYEDGSLNLRKHILSNYQLKFFYQFENRQGIFPEVDSRYKFALFQISPSPTPALPESLTPDPSPKERGVITPPPSEGAGGRLIPVRFMQTDVGILNTQDAILNYTYADIRLLSPAHWALMEIKQPLDLEILRKAYRKFPPINPDYIDFRNELHSTADRNLFKEQKDDFPLYEGKMVHQFDSKFSEPLYYVNAKALWDRLLSVEISRMTDDLYPQIPLEFLNPKLGKQKNVLAYLGLASEADLAQFVVYDPIYPRLVFRKISRNTDERTLITSLIPSEATLQDSLYAHIPKKYIFEEKRVEVFSTSLRRVLFVNAVLNSLVVDFMARFIIDINVNKTYLMRLPIPQPSEEELLQSADYQILIKNALKLNLAANPQGFENLKSFMENLGEIPSTDKQKTMLKIENDCLVARLYGISEAELRHLTSEAYFKVLNDKNPAYIQTLLSRYQTDFR
ncbi:MAG: Eco57I restriction-modification methylase domain-containing protein [Microscillaceae bacterium]|nr:Eco57I restriction-modification methylase domain-containing protein [Microscillaceae bacterium]